MGFDGHKNFAYSTVLTAPVPATSGTSLVVATGNGANFATPPFNATVWPAGVAPTNTNAEIVRVTAKTTDTLTIVRGQEGTGLRTIVVGDQIAAGVTAKTLTDIETNSGSSMRPPTVLVLGASIEQNEGSDWPLNNGTPLLEPNPTFGGLGPINWASAFLGGRLRTIKNAASAPTTSDQQLVNIQNPAHADYALGLNPAPGFVYIGAVTGDDPGTLTPAQSAANDLAIINLMIATYPQAIIVLVTLPGVNIPAGTGNAATRATVNPQRRTLAQQTPNIMLFDFEGVYTNPSTGLPVTTYSQDSIHPNPTGAMVLGQSLASALSPQLQSSVSGLVNDYFTDSRVSVANGGWTTDAMMPGTPGANTTATNWIFSNTSGGAVPAGATRALVARTDQYGNWQQIVYGGTAGGLAIYRGYTYSFPTNAIIQGECEVLFNGDWPTGGITDFSLTISTNLGGGANTNGFGNQLANQGPYTDPGAGVKMVMRTAPLVCPAGVTSGFFVFNLTNTLTTGSVKIGRMSLVRLA